MVRQALSLEQHLRRMTRRKAAAWVLASIVLLLLFIADRRGWLLHESAEWSRYEGRQFKVVRVIDGDTLDVDAPDSEYPVTRIRLWGMDTPELANPREGKVADAFAAEAFAFTRSQCEGLAVTIRMDRHQSRDRYGRLLAYIVLPDGAVLNEVLLLEGLARYVDRFPHQHIERYELLEKQARFEKKGIWAQ